MRASGSVRLHVALSVRASIDCRGQTGDNCHEQTPHPRHRRHLHGRRRRAGARTRPCGRRQRPERSIRRCPPSSKQLGIALHAGLRGRATSPPTATRSWSATRSRAATPRSSTCSTPGCAYTSGAQWLGEHVLPGRDTLAVAGTHGKTTTTTILAYLLEAAGRDAGLPDRRRGRGFRRVRAHRRRPRIRGRGRRIRHRVLRQAQQVRALPAAGGDPQQPRVRPRRHLPGRRRDPAPVPPPGAHRAAARPADRQRRGRAPGRSAGDGLLDAGRALRLRRVRLRLERAPARRRRQRVRACCIAGERSRRRATGRCSAATT